MKRFVNLILSAALAAVIAVAAGSCVSDGPSPDDEEYGEYDESGKFDGEVVRLAIFDFEVKAHELGYEALATDVPGALAEAFLRGGFIQPLERTALEKVLAEMELSLSGLVDPGTAAKVGKLAGARYTLLGQASVVGDQVRLSCRIVDVETSEIVYAGSAYGDVSDIFDIEAELAELVEYDFSE